MRLTSLIAMTWSLCSKAEPPPGAHRTTTAPPAAERVYQHGLQKGWMDFGWSPRKKDPDGTEAHNFKGYGGWILAREISMNAAQAGGVSFTYKAPPDYGDFLEVKLDKPGTSGRDWEKIHIGGPHKRPLPGGGFEVFIPMAELNPKRNTFDRIVFFAYREVPSGWVTIDDVSLTVPGATEGAPVAVQGTPQKLAVQCNQKKHTINPRIYGIAFYPMWEYRDDHHWALKPTGRRWGGNHTSRYNYQLGEAWSAGSDWFFRNLTYTGRPGWTWETFLESNAAHGVESVITLPMIGWVAKDTTSFSYPVSEFPSQQDFEQSSGAGNGRDKKGNWLPPVSPTRTSIEAGPDFISGWVKAIKEKSTKLKNPVRYILDNEPALWDHTHHDVHPEPLGYDELWTRTRAYAAAIKKADPTAIIEGPAEWGWSNYFYSRKDLKLGGPTVRADRRAHGDVPLIPWYLKKLAEYEKQNKIRLVDVLDVHFYPQAEGLGIAETGDTSPEASLRRIRSTRALWDPTYHDESWIDDKVQLIPRLKKWVSENSPGLGVSIGEWNFGAENHISGGLAVAEALGRFGEQNLTSAYYWSYPPDGSPAYWAFRAFRDYDGQGAHFENVSLGTTAPAGTSAFASMAEDGSRLVLVALNLDPKTTVQANISTDGCPEAKARRYFYFGEKSKRLESKKLEGKGPVTLEPFSINVLEWSFKK